MLCDNADHISKVSKEIASEIAESRRCRQPHRRLTPAVQRPPIFVVGFENACVLKQSAQWALHGHPRSLILAPIENAYATSYRSSIVTLVQSCPVLEILQVCCSEHRHQPNSTREFWGTCSAWNEEQRP